jgi:hypothetical protein
MKPQRELIRQLVAVKFKASELQMLLAKSIKYTDGNVSKLIRDAVAAYKK